MTRSAFRSGAGLLLCLAAVAVEAQDTSIGPPPVQYNFAPPGARSLAMGASFIGLADDATASESNPAGLTILTRPEVSAHFRYSSFVNEAPDTVSGAGFARFTDRQGSPAFFSVVYPRGNQAFSLYYQAAADYRAHSFFDGLLGDGTPNYDQLETRFRVENAGLSAATRIGSKLSAGASIRLTRTQLQATQRTSFPSFGSLSSLEGTVDETKSKATFNAGLLFRPASWVSVGAVYKHGGDFSFDETVAIRFRDVDGNDNTDSAVQQIRVTVPKSYGAGVALRPTDSFLLTADLVRINYSEADLGPGNENLYQIAGQGGREDLKNATEIHVGTEYTWPVGNDWILALRGGFYTDPDHDGLAGLDSADVHATFGGGVVVLSKLQIDVAVNLATRVKEGLVSFVVRF
jgi:long-subunit fatty acid transport protein